MRRVVERLDAGFGQRGVSAVRLRRGVTLIELLVVLGIVAVLAAAFAVRMSRARATASEDALQGTARAMGAAISAYYLANGCYPSDAPDWTSGEPGGPAAMPPGMQPYVNEWPHGVAWDYHNGSGWGAVHWWRPGGGWVREGVFYGPRC